MENKQEIKIKAKEEDLKGVYSNMARVIQAKEEFILDFMMILPPEGTLNSRVIMSPGHAKRLANVLSNNIAKYEQQFGKVEEAEAKEEKLGF